MPTLARLAKYERIRHRRHRTTHWKAELTVPREYGKYHPRPIDLKCSPLPKHGFVEDVESDEYVTVGATLVIVENFQPTFEVNKFIDKLIDDAEVAEAFTDDLESKLSVARESENES